jgi:alkylation response protein AidB-like acyl-CoA dehydrogenase
MNDRDDLRATVLGRAQELRQEFAATAAEVDQHGDLPVANLKRLQESGLGNLLVPTKWGGGASDDGTASDLDILSEILVELSAGESSTAQIWSIHSVVSRLVLSDKLEIDPDLQAELAAGILEGRLRLSNASAEGGATRVDVATTATRKGDHFILDGTKIFATGSEGSDYAIVPAISDAVPGGGLAYLLVSMAADGVRQHDDWNNMGQRATASGSVSFDQVAVPARYHLAIKGGAELMYGPDSVFGLVFQTGINSVILGMGHGAFDITCEFVSKYARPNLPSIDNAAEDPVNQWHVGRLSAQLAGARALLRESTRAIWDFERYGGERGPISVHMMRAKYAVNEAVLEATGQLHRLAGGRATGNKYRLDRFWRNARTLSVHDSIDAKLRHIGAFEISGTAPPSSIIS